MTRVTDITFHANSEYADTDALLKAQQASLFYTEALKNKVEIEVIKHISGNRTKTIERNGFRFFFSKNKPGYIAKATIDHLKKTKPGIVIIHGLHFPLHIIRLKWILGRKAKIIAWHHADTPVKWPKKSLYILADACIEKYFFTSLQNAQEWIDAGIIGHERKVYEVPPTLTIFTRQDKTAAKQNVNMQTAPNYLWVGRFDKVKDPVTVINAFEKFLAITPSARLHMIYQSGGLQFQVQKIMEEKASLRDRILLHGYVPNNDLDNWYSAADFFISSSLREAGSVTLLEAMSCGCIPIITTIPASLKVTDDGKLGFQYNAGETNGLVNALLDSRNIDQKNVSNKVESHFIKEYSVSAVTEKLITVFESLVDK